MSMLVLIIYQEIEEKNYSMDSFKNFKEVPKN